MINPVVIKSTAGIVVGGSTVGAGIYFKNDIWNFIAGNNESYLIVKAEAAATNFEELYNTEKTEKKYFCRMADTTDKKDETCKLHEIKNDEAKKFLTISQVNGSKEEIKEKSKIEQNKYYKLAVDSTKFNITDWTKKIELVVIKADKSEAKYSSLLPIVQVNGKKVTGKHSFVLSQIDTVNKPSSDTSTSTGYKCKIKDENLSCNIFGFTTAVADLKTIDFSKTQKVDNTNKLTKKDDFYIVNFSTEDELTKVTDETMKEINYIKESDSSVLIKFKFHSKAFGVVGDSASSNFVFLDANI